jgi:predicted ABC-type ATPase
LKPALLVIAGPNGSGKTTVTRVLRRDHWSQGVEYINPDEIALERFGDWNSPTAILEAANWAEQRRETLLSERAGIAFETVFSAPDKLDFVRRAKRAGYFVRMFFVSTSDPSINATRVAQRMMNGGHGVPLEKIIARYERSMVLLAAAITLMNRVYLYDNSVAQQEARLCARVSDGQLRKIYRDLPEWVEDAIKDLIRHPEFEDLRNPS